VPNAKTASILLDGWPVGTPPFTTSKFAERKAIVISLNPGSVDFHDLETKQSLVVNIADQRFEMAMLARDGVAHGMDRCLAHMRHTAERVERALTRRAP
jgi:hypothetical protein